MVATSRAARSAASTRKSRLLCATALMSVLLPLAVAQAQEAQYRYTTTGVHDDDITINTAVNMSTAAGTVATYAGNLRFNAAGSAAVH